MRLRLEKPITYLITEGRATDSGLGVDSILNTIRLAVEEKISLVQIREKNLSARALFELTAAAAKLTHRSATRLLVNDRADIALAAGADGVHLRANSIPTQAVRRSVPEDFVIGVSTHWLAAAAEASRQGADFAVFGPVFGTPGKNKPTGLENLRHVCDRLAPFPVIGLGGIDSVNYHSVLEAGARGIAAIRALNDLESLRAIARFSTVGSDKCQVDSPD